MADGSVLVVFGAAGQVGRALAALPVPTGWRLLALDRAAVDITDAEQVAGVLADIQSGVVVNLAAFTQVDRAEEIQAQAFAVNRDGAECLARAASAAGLPLIHLSTDYVFPGTGSAPLAEDAPTEPCNIYGASKLAGERAVLAAHPYAVVLRTAWVFGIDGANFVKSILRRACSVPELGVVADQTGCPTPAPAIATAIWTLAQRLLSTRDAADFGLFHFAGTPATNWYEFARAILALAAAEGLAQARAVPITTRDYPTPAARPAHSVLDCGRIAARHGIAQPDWLAHLRIMFPKVVEAL